MAEIKLTAEGLFEAEDSDAMNTDDMSNAEEESLLRKQPEEDEDPQSESEDDISNAQAATKKSNEQEHKQNRKGDSAKSRKILRQINRRRHKDSPPR